MFETTNQMFLPVGLWVKIKDPQKKQRRSDSLHVGAWMEKRPVDGFLTWQLRTGSAGCLMEILTMGCILIELVNWNTMQLPSIKRIYPHGTQVFKWVVCRSTWPFQTISSVKISKEHQPSSTFWTAQRLNPHREATARMAQTLRLPQAVPTRKRRKVQFWSSESRPRPSKDWPPSTRAGWEEALGFSWWWFFGKNEQGWC